MPLGTSVLADHKAEALRPTPKGGRFTSWDDPALDNRIAADLDAITSELMAAVRPETVVLAGSFGRGEGSVVRLPEGYKFLSDYEIGVVVNSAWGRSRMRKAAERLRERVSAEVSLFWLTSSRLRENRYKTLTFGRATPTVFMYDLLAGSQLLCGQPLAAADPMGPRNLPPHEGLYLILNRMMEVVGRYLQGAERGPLAHSCAKTLMACGDALLIRSGRYDVSSRKRLEILKTEYQTLCRVVLPEFDFLDFYAMALETRLKPVNSQDGVVRAFFDGVVDEACRSVLAFLARSEMNWEGDGWQSWARAYLRYCDEYVAPIYRVPRVPVPDVLYENSIQTLKLWLKGLSAKWWRVMPQPWRQLMFAVIPALYFSAPWNRMANPDLAVFAENWLRKFLALPNVPRHSDWSTPAVQAFRVWQVIS